MNNDKSQIDLKNYWAILGRRKSLFILPLMIVPLVAFLATYFMQPSYVSSVTILLSDTKVLPMTVQQDIEGRGADYSRISMQERQNSYYNQITSTKYLRRLIAVLDIPVGNDVKKLVDATKADFPQISETDLSENILADNLREKVTVNMRANNLIEVSFAASDPVTAQQRASALAGIFIEENLATELAGIRSSISFSEEQLAFYKDKLKAAEDKMRDFRQSLLKSSFEGDTSSTNLQEIASAVQALDLEISSRQDQQSAMRSRLAASEIDISTLVLPAEITFMRDRLLSNANKLGDLLWNYNWKDVKVYSINEESRNIIIDLTAEIRNWIARDFAEKPPPVRDLLTEYFVGNSIIDYDRSKRAILDRYIGKTQAKLEEDPAVDISMQRLQSEIDSYKEFYDLFVSHSQNAAINQSAKKVEAEAKYTIIRPASLPLSPDSPNRIKILGMGIALGLAIGFGAIMLIELLDNSFKKVEDVAEYLNLQVIGTIPRMNLPFSGPSKKKIPLAIGFSISFVLIVLIIFFNLKKSG